MWSSWVIVCGARDLFTLGVRDSFTHTKVDAELLERVPLIYVLSSWLVHLCDSCICEVCDSLICRVRDLFMHGASDVLTHSQNAFRETILYEFFFICVLVHSVELNTESVTHSVCVREFVTHLYIELVTHLYQEVVTHSHTHRSTQPSERWGLGSRPKKMYGERLGDGVEYHLMSPTPHC